MDAVIRLLNVVLPMLYALAVAAYAVDFWREEKDAARAARRLMDVLLVGHVLYLAARTAAFEHVPLASTPEVLTTVALAVALVYVAVERRIREHRTGVFLVSVSFVLQTLSSAFIGGTGEPPSCAARCSPHRFRPSSATRLSRCRPRTACCSASLYHQLKRRRFGRIFDRLPRSRPSPG
jgi:hypothetical protein